MGPSPVCRGNNAFFCRNETALGLEWGQERGMRCLTSSACPPSLLLTPVILGLKVLRLNNQFGTSDKLGSSYSRASAYALLIPLCSGPSARRKHPSHSHARHSQSTWTSVPPDMALHISPASHLGRTESGDGKVDRDESPYFTLIDLPHYNDNHPGYIVPWLMATNSQPREHSRTYSGRFPDLPRSK